MRRWQRDRRGWLPLRLHVAVRQGACSVSDRSRTEAAEQKLLPRHGLSSRKPGNTARKLDHAEGEVARIYQSTGGGHVDRVSINSVRMWRGERRFAARGPDLDLR